MHSQMESRLFKATGIWLVIVVAAIVNGVFREKVAVEKKESPFPFRTHPVASLPVRILWLFSAQIDVSISPSSVATK